MSRYECQRCGVPCFTTDIPHLCKDVLVRHRRREAQVKAVMPLLDYLAPQERRRVAESIVTKLAGMGVVDD